MEELREQEEEYNQYMEDIDNIKLEKCPKCREIIQMKKDFVLLGHGNCGWKIGD